MIKPVYDFNEQTQFEIDNLPICEDIYKQLNLRYKINTDIELQKLGIDTLAVDVNNNRLLIDNKITKLLYKHPTHMLLEWESFWNNNDQRYKLGWIRDDSLFTTHILDICLENKTYYLYDYVGLKEFVAKQNYNLSNYSLWPKDENEIYVPRFVKNKWMYTKNIFLPRNLINQFLITKGTYE